MGEYTRTCVIGSRHSKKKVARQDSSLQTPAGSHLMNKLIPQLRNETPNPILHGEDPAGQRMAAGTNMLCMWQKYTS